MRRDQVLATLQRSNTVSQCWSLALRRDPAHVAELVFVVLVVAPDGRAEVVVRGARDASLARCIRDQARTQFYGAGAPVAAEAQYRLARGG